MPSKPKYTPDGGRPAAERQFVDREEFVAPVHAALKEPPRAKPLVLVFHGGAGIGKSRLRRELVRQLARDPEVLTATLDFDVTGHRHPETALFFLRRTLCEACQVRFPSFDLAYAIYWQKTHPETPLSDELKPLLESGSLLPQLLDDSGKLPVIGLVPRILSLLGKSPEPPDPRTHEPLLRSWWSSRGERELEDLPQMEPGAIVECLPKLWAADLKEFLVHRSSFIANRRAVLFIDSYEKLWDIGVTEADFFKRDEWVRELVKQLTEVLWVVCGRQKLRWEEVEGDWGNALSQHLLEALPEKSARRFLESCDISDGQTQDAIVKGSQGVPHYLNIAADAVQSAKCRAQNVEFMGTNPEELVEQFTRHLDKPEVETLRVLSATRFWYYGLFEQLVNQYGTGYPLTGYDDLARFSFIKDGVAPGTRTMHELMREALQESQPPELRKGVHRFLYEYYAKQLEGLEAKNITDSHRIALIEAFYHGRQAKSAEGLWPWFEAAAGVFDDTHQHRLLMPLYREMVEALDAELGPSHLRAGAALLKLGRFLRVQAEYDEAEPLLRRAVAIAEKEHGPEHPFVLECLRELAHLLLERARYAEAEGLCRRVVGKLENEPVTDAHIRSEALDGLAHALSSQGKYAEAEELYRRSLAVCESEMGPEHRSTGHRLSNLSVLLFNQARYAEAEPLVRRALEIQEKALGPNHPLVAWPLNNLAATLHYLGRYVEAEPLYRRALKLKEETLGPEHDNTAWTIHNLASLLLFLGRHAEAEALQRRALAVIEKKQGPRHPATIRIADTLIHIMARQGKYAEAEPLALRSVEVCEKERGPDNPETARALNTAGVVYSGQGRYAEAENLLRRGMEIRTRILGPTHPDTLGSLDAQASLEDRRGRTGEAESLLRDLLDRQARGLGSHHPNLARTAERLAGICARDARYAEAESLYRRALAIREKVFGPDHTFVAEVLDGLSKVCEQTGRTAEAQELSSRAQRIRAQAQSASAKPQ